MWRDILLSDINLIEFCGQILMYVPTIIFHEDPSSGRRVVSFWKADTHDEADIRFSQLSQAVQEMSHEYFHFLYSSHTTPRSVLCELSFAVKK
jgi:hypothetical protein